MVKQKAKPLSFEDALRRVMQVSKDDMKRLQANSEAMEWVREKRGPKAKGQLHSSEGAALSEASDQP